MENAGLDRRGLIHSKPSLFDVALGGNDFVEVLQVGRPAQEMRVVFDTGSGNLVLPAAECLDIHIGHMAVAGCCATFHVSQV